jgi:hypothetical protein
MGNERFAAIQADCEDLNFALSEQCLYIRLGFWDSQRTGPIYADHPMATSEESIAFLREMMETHPDGDLREQAARLYFSCIGHFIRMDLLLVDQTLDQFFREASVTVDGERLGFGSFETWIMVQKDFLKRELLREKATPLLQKASELRARIWKETATILREDFGFPSYAAFCEAKKAFSFESLARTCTGFLQATDEPYMRLVPPWVEQALGRPMDALSRYHAIHLLTLTEFDHGFPKGRLLDAIRRTLEDLGFAHLVDGRIHVDAEERESKSPSSRCVPLIVPRMIHVTVKPQGGMYDYEALLHEMGHALHLSNADSTLPYAYRHLPRSYALTECFAFLLEGLMREPAWLSRFSTLTPEEIHSLCRHKQLKRLCVVRRYAAKFLFERQIFSRDEADPGGIYARTLKRATGFVYEPEAAFIDLEEEFYAADYLMAWIGEACLREHLRVSFGEEWFFQREAGEYMKGIWRRGERWGLDYLMEQLGHRFMDLEPLLRALESLSGTS